MATHQVRKEKAREQGVGVGEKDKVPKMSSQFETLTLSPAELHQQSGGGKAAEHGGRETKRAGNVGKFEMQGEEEKDLKMEGGRGGDTDISQYRQAAQQNSIDALRAAEDRYNKAKEVTSEKSAQAKDSLKQGAQRTSQYATGKGGVLKDTAVEKGQPLYETTRDTLVGAGKTAGDYTVQAKDYAAEKAVGAKDVVGNVAMNVKDKAVVGGWGAGEYTAEKVVGATKAMADVSAGAVGYVGETAVAAKDKVGSVGMSAKDYAAQKLAAAKDAVVATEESAKDYAARKREEAEREMQAKESGENVGEFYQEQPEYGREGQQGGRRSAEAKGGGGGVLQAIGETVLEIGQTTQDLLVGKRQTQATETMKDSTEYNK